LAAVSSIAPTAPTEAHAAHLERRARARIEDRLEEDPAEVQAHQREARDDRAREQLADRDRLRSHVAEFELRLLVRTLQDVADEDQHRGRRDDLPQRARSADRAGRELRIVAGAHHRRQRQQAHRHDGGADDARRGRQQRPDDHDRITEAATQRAEQFAHGRQQRLGDLRALEHHAHEDEQRHRDQRLVGHRAEVAADQGREDGRVEHAQRHSEPGEDQRDAGERECHGIAREHRADRRHEHGHRHDFADQHAAHRSSSP
jgi:hypothetical protein